MLPEIKIKFITQLCNAILRQHFFLIEGCANYHDSEVWQSSASSEFNESYRLLAACLIEII